MFGAAVADATAREVLLREWGLDGKRNARFADLSGGQQQRLFVALALVNQPELVFLDEMTTGLDPAARREAWQLIERIRERGTTIVLVTHFMDEAEKLCDRIAIVRNGRIIALDTPERLIAAHPSNTVIRSAARPIRSVGSTDFRASTRPGGTPAESSSEATPQPSLTSAECSPNVTPFRPTFGWLRPAWRTYTCA